MQFSLGWPADSEGRGIFSAKAGIGAIGPGRVHPAMIAVAGYSESTSKHPAVLRTMHSRLGRIPNSSKVPIHCIQPNLFTLCVWRGSRQAGDQSQNPSSLHGLFDKNVTSRAEASWLSSPLLLLPHPRLRQVAVLTDGIAAPRFESMRNDMLALGPMDRGLHMI